MKKLKKDKCIKGCDKPQYIAKLCQACFGEAFHSNKSRFRRFAIR